MLLRTTRGWGRTFLSHPHYYTQHSIGRGIIFVRSSRSSPTKMENQRNSSFVWTQDRLNIASSWKPRCHVCRVQRFTCMSSQTGNEKYVEAPMYHHGNGIHISKLLHLEMDFIYLGTVVFSKLHFYILVPYFMLSSMSDINALNSEGDCSSLYLPKLMKQLFHSLDILLQQRDSLAPGNVMEVKQGSIIIGC